MTGKVRYEFELKPDKLLVWTEHSFVSGRLPLVTNGSCVRSNITNITRRDKLISKATFVELLLCLADHKRNYYYEDSVI